MRLVTTPGTLAGTLEDLLALAGAVFYAAGGLNNDFAVARFLADGTPDPTFSGDGIAFGGFKSAGYNGASIKSSHPFLRIGRPDWKWRPNGRA